MNKDKIVLFPQKLYKHILIHVLKFMEYLPINKLSLSGIAPISGRDELVSRLELMLGNTIPDIIRKASDKERESILLHAEKAKLHIFDILGSGPIKMDSINWSLELKTGFVWPVGVFYSKIPPLTPEGADIKVPWELSRCHHLLWMAEAYCLTRDESYAEEVVLQISNWIKNNPLMRSVNWTCAMDVSIRAVNWMYALAIIGDSKVFSDEFAKEVYRTLYQHLFFINCNLENRIPYSNNHYFSDIVGQLYLGFLFSNTSRGKCTINKACKEFYKEIIIQFLPSGVNYERSVSYHRLMTELVLFPYYMLCRTSHNIPEIITDRLSRAIGYINQYTMVNGSSPMVSDNDDGRLLPIVPTPFMNHTYLANEFSLESRIASAGCKWIAPAYTGSISCVHADANLAILRKESMYLYVSCFYRWLNDGFKKEFIGTHLHNDLLSFVFADGATPIIIDPGAYCYTSDVMMRKSFRSAKKHNTIIVDDEEPNLQGDAAFLMKYNTYAKPMLFISGEVEHCECEYSTIEGKMTHHREFDLSSNMLVIRDSLKKTGRYHHAYMSFHFSEEVEAAINGESICLSIGSMRYNVSVDTSVNKCMRIINDTVSPSFGVLINSFTLVVEYDFNDKAECITTFKRIK